MIDRTAKIHDLALIEEDVSIGPGTRVWAFAHILSGVEIGSDCNICDHTFIEGKVVLGNRVTVKTGVSIWQGVTVEDDVFIGPSVAFVNDLRPRSKKYPERFETTLIRQGASIGSNATILAGIELGAWCLVGAGSVVTKSVPDYSLVVGNPARFQYWVCRCSNALTLSNDVVCGECGSRYRLLGDTLEYVNSPLPNY